MDIAPEIGAADQSTPSPHRRFSSAWVGPVLGVAVALWLVTPVIGARPPAGEDVMAHLVRADFGISHLVGHGRLDGWFPRFVLGQQEFLFNGPGLTWLMALLRALTFGTLSNTGALKAVSILSYAAVPPAVWFLARSYGLSRHASELAGLFALCVSNPFGVGLEGLFRVGLVPHQVAAVFFCLALGACMRLLGDRRRRWILLSAASLAALAVTHLISVVLFALMFGLTILCLMAVRRLPARGLARLAAAAAGALGLAAFWVLPLVAHRDLRGVVTTWGTPPLGERLGRILTGDLLFPAGFALVVLAGWLFQLTRVRRHPEIVAWVAAPAAYLVVAHGSVVVATGNEITMQLANRGLGYVGLVSVLAVGALLAAASSRFGAPGRGGALVLAAFTVLMVAPGRDVADQLPEPVPQLRDAAGELARRVPDGARFATQRDFPGEVYRTGVIHPETWLARVSGRNSLNGFNLEASSTPRAAFEPDRLDEVRPVTSANRMSRLGVTHVVTTSDTLAERLAASERYTVAWQESPVAILRVIPPPGQPSPASLLSAPTPLEARLVDHAPEHLAFAVSSETGTEVTVALAWSPKWRARIGDRPARLWRTSDGLAMVTVPHGDSLLRLEYESVDGWDRAGMTISAATLAGGVAAARRWRGRRRRQPMSRSFSRTA